MESGISGSNAAPMSELEKLQKEHDGKLARIQELKEKKEAMMLEQEKKKRDNSEKMKEFEDLRGKYNDRMDTYNALKANKSLEN